MGSIPTAPAIYPTDKRKRKRIGPTNSERMRCMSKASFIAGLLRDGQTIERYKEAGNSMLPLIKSNQPVMLEPVSSETKLEIDDIVFCKVKGNYYTHKITGIKGKQYQISNNHGFVNGWITRDKIFGKVVKIWEK